MTDVDAPSIPGEVEATVRATVQGQPLRDTRVTFAGGAARTDNHGIATVTTTLEQPGRFSALARNGAKYGLSASSRRPVAVGEARTPACRGARRR